MSIGDDGVASICVGQAHTGDPCEVCGHEVVVDIALDELLGCPFCGAKPDEFEDGEIQCSNKHCPARPSVRWNGRGAWNTRVIDE